MKVFLSSCYSRRDELRNYRQVLEAEGYEVVSRWLDTEWNEKEEDGSSSVAPPEYRAEFALKDLEDVGACDTLVAFTEDPSQRGGKGNRGGRHVEFGAALVLRKTVIVYGPPEHIFHHHHRCLSVATSLELLQLLRRVSEGRAGL